MPTELAKQYDPREAQQRWLTFWNERGFFHSDPDERRQPYTIVIPPPNVTGALHMGHALNNTLQDVLIRWRRMQGRNALWVPGTDHAGIATQAVVEKRIFQEEKKTRHDLGREELVRRIWQWKDQYEARILNQLKQLGASCDWRRTRFTLDEICTRAVRQTFFDLFKAGLIYRGKRLVNWDASLQTSVADDETYTEDTRSGFWTFKYEVQGDDARTQQREYIRFSTTRPETMLGDTAVCVHPQDERYKHLIGKQVLQPLTNRLIPIIADGQLADPTLGTGCVKVTPAHDPNDYACWQRHPEIGIINILNPDGSINEQGGRFQGMDRYKAREACIKAMEELGLFEGREDRVIPLKYSDRSKTPIEPYLSDQWFVRMADVDGRPGLAQQAMDAVTSGKVKFHPERYARSYLDWLGEKRDWCISRQLWWGHRIPIWYARCSEADLKRTFGSRSGVAWRFDSENDQWLICAVSDEPELISPDSKLNAVQDPDVLDTWFSSQLWPHSTLGWPESTPELRYYYPTSVLVTSRDIITLWVARMVIASQFNLKMVPFHDVYITPKLLDGFGETMSKSKGNGVDPLDIIDRYGTDALRFVMVQAAGETQDYRLPVSNVCPQCGTLVPVKSEHMYMRTRKLNCPNCKQPFRPGGPWPGEDSELKTAQQASEKFEIGRNFANKLWNASRFLLMNLEGYRPGVIHPADLPTEDRWILSRLATVAAEVTSQLEAFHFSDVTRTLYDFTWSEFCDWYIEMAKSRLKASADENLAEAGFSGPGTGASSRALAQRVLVGVLDTILRLLHPVMPFVTESIWQALAESAFERGLPEPQPAAESVMIAPWPSLPTAWRDPDMERRIGRMQDLIRAIRNIRNEFVVNERAAVDVVVRCSPSLAQEFHSLSQFIQPLARVGTLQCGPDVSRPVQAATAVHADFEAYVNLRGLIDIDAETKRLTKQKADKERALQGIRSKLANESFTAKAPPEVVAQQRSHEAELVQQIEAIVLNLKQLGASP